MPIQGEGVGRISKDQGVMQELRPKRGKGAGKERSEGRAPRQRESERVETLVGQGGGKAFLLYIPYRGLPALVSPEYLGNSWDLSGSWSAQAQGCSCPGAPWEAEAGREGGPPASLHSSSSSAHSFSLCLHQQGLL